MFHTGSLQSGISRAIEEQKLVACFVRDEGEESALWEDDWLQNGWKAVVLRLEAGSTDAGFLSAFCPVSNTPTFVVIQNGQLREQLTSGIEKEDFINRIRQVLGASSIPGASQHSTATARAVSTSERPQPPHSTLPPASSPQQLRPVSSILPPSSKAKGKQKVNPPADPSPAEASSTTAAQQLARDALRKKKQDEKGELARIQARIEANKAERKSQAEARKSERELQANSASIQTQPTVSTNNRASQAKDVHLNVRLFDGRTIRSIFPRTATLQENVRPWIDEAVAASIENPNEKHPPYIFKQIQAPLPSRELTVGDEGQTLGDIDLAPSATLVLIPVKGFTEAYSGNNSGIAGGVVGGVTGLVGGAFGMAYSAVGYVGNALGSVVGYGGAGIQGQEQASTGRTLSEPRAESSGTSNVRVRTLADQRAGEPRSQQLYNGNQLNFEPNDDEPNRR